MNIKTSILNLARTNIMKMTQITISHQLEITQHHFIVENPDKLTSLEVDRIKEEMGVEMVFVSGRLYKWKKGSTLYLFKFFINTNKTGN
jgi:hypothetical protein